MLKMLLFCNENRRLILISKTIPIRTYLSINVKSMKNKITSLMKRI